MQTFSALESLPNRKKTIVADMISKSLVILCMSYSIVSSLKCLKGYNDELEVVQCYDGCDMCMRYQIGDEGSYSDCGITVVHELKVARADCQDAGIFADSQIPKQVYSDGIERAEPKSNDAEVENTQRVLICCRGDLCNNAPLTQLLLGFLIVALVII